VRVCNDKFFANSSVSAVKDSFFVNFMRFVVPFFGVKRSLHRSSYFDLRIFRVSMYFNRKGVEGALKNHTTTKPL
jgi:hypothetical protein